MLFSAGMGIGLLFYGVAEPIMHFTAPPHLTPESHQAAVFALQTTFFHWGFHPWAIYVLFGMSLAYFHYRKGRPLSIRSALIPLFGKRVEGTLGDIIDIFAILGTLFGVSTSLGLGAMQVNSGLNYLLDVPVSSQVQILLIATITILATISVVSGLDKGIRILSEFNMSLGTLLVILVFVLGPTVTILNIMTQSAGHYFQTLVSKMFYTNAFGDQQWVAGWTIFYWAWWLSWAPFVGIFIARISGGRTIREFVLNVLLVPTLLSIAWFSIYGGSAIAMELAGDPGITAAVKEDISTALFFFFQQLPISGILCALGTIVIVTFFVTSSDSGSFVIDMIAAGGNPNPPAKQKVFWAVLEGLVAAALLLGGGKASLKTIQTAAVATGLPLAIILILMGIALIKALRKEKLESE